GRAFQIPPHITKLTGIDAAKIEANGNHGIREVMEKTVRAIRDLQDKGYYVVPVGHNGVFDLRFFDHTLSREELGQKDGGKTLHYTFDGPYVDTLDVAIKLNPEDKTHSLDDVMARVGVEDPTLPRHDGYSDVVLLGRCLPRMI